MRLQILLIFIAFAAGFYSGSVHPFHEPKPAANAYDIYFCPEDACNSQVIRQIDEESKVVCACLIS